MYPFFIAWRYTITGKRWDAVHIVALISSLAMGAVAAAAIVILSVFNGYEHLLLQSTSPFDAPLVLKKSDGTVFDARDSSLQKLLSSPQVDAYSLTLQSEGVLFAEGESTPVMLFGSDAAFPKVCKLTSSVALGRYRYGDEHFLIGADSYSFIGMPPLDDSVPVTLLVPRRKGSINPLLSNTAFVQRSGILTGVVNAGQEQYNSTLFLSQSALAELLDYPPSFCAEIALKPTANLTDDAFRNALNKLLPNDFDLLTRREQQPFLMRLVAVEKWLSFSILLFVVLLAAFNIICSSAMLLIEKERDTRLFAALGMPQKSLRTIFFLRSFLTTLAGVAGGLILGTLLLLLQRETGFVSYPEGLERVAYPVAFRLTDYAAVLGALLLLGAISALLPPRILLKHPLPVDAQ